MRKSTRLSHMCTSTQQLNGLYTVSVRLTGENVTRRASAIPMILDTGARYVGITRTWASTLGLKQHGTEKIFGVSGKDNEVPATWADLIVDERIRIPGVRVVQIESIGIAAGLLGMSFLNQIQFYADVSRSVPLGDVEVPLIRFYYPPEYAIDP